MYIYHSFFIYQSPPSCSPSCFSFLSLILERLGGFDRSRKFLKKDSATEMCGNIKTKSEFRTFLFDTCFKADEDYRIPLFRDY